MRDNGGNWHDQNVSLPSGSTTAPLDILLRYIEVESDGSTALVVGDKGLWAWSEDADSTSGTYTGLQLSHSTLGSPQLWASYIFDGAIDPPGGKYWVVGDDGFLASTDHLKTPNTGLTQASFASGQNPGTIDLHGIDFVPGTYRGAVVGGDHIWYADVDSTSNVWTKATINWTDDNGTPITAPTGFVFWKVAFVPTEASEGDPDNHHGYAVGGMSSSSGAGRIFRTTDGGVTWTRELYECDDDAECNPSEECDFPAETEDCPSYDPGGGTVGDVDLGTLYGVTTFDDGSAVAVGYGSTIIERPPTSAGSGVRWFYASERCDYPTSPLWGVHSDSSYSSGASSGAIWIVGQPNQIRNRIGGGSWVQEGWEEHWRFGRGTFVSGGTSTLGEVGWIVGQYFRIARTIDGGVTWVEQRASTEGGEYCTDIAFYDDGNSSRLDDNGVAVGTGTGTNGVTIFYTMQGGETVTQPDCGWEVASTPAIANCDLRSVCFSGRNEFDDNEFWACGTGNTILRSVDNGATWDLEAPSATTGATWSGISFLHEDVGFVVGQDSSGNGIAYRFDETTTPQWTHVPLKNTSGGTLTTPLTAVHTYVSAAFAVGNNGTVLKYNRFENPVPAFVQESGAVGLTTQNLLSVRIVPNGSTADVFAGGANGALLRRTGTTWAAIRSRTNCSISQLSFFDTDKGYLFGMASDLVGGISVLMHWH